MILGAVVVTAAVATAPLCCLAAGNEICDDEGAEEAGAAILGCSEGQRVARATRGDRLLPQRRAPGTSDRTQVFSVGSADASRRLGEEQANGIRPGGAVLFLSFFYIFFFSFPVVLQSSLMSISPCGWSGGAAAGPGAHGPPDAPPRGTRRDASGIAHNISCSVEALPGPARGPAVLLDVAWHPSMTLFSPLFPP